LDQERERLERRLLIWLAQKERTEAQIADVERARDQLLATLEPAIRSEVEEAERAEAIPRQKETKRRAPIPIRR
jgi:anti-sigma factor RsiW